MLRVKIKDFKLNTDDKIGLEATLPCSLSTVLAREENTDPWRVHSDTSTVEFTGVVEIEPHVLAMKHICLRLSGISEPAEVVLNGKTISTPESRERIYVYNVKDRLFPGYNTLVVRFARNRRADALPGIRLRRGEAFDPAIKSATLLAFDAAAISSVNVTETHNADGVTVGVNMGIIGDKEGVRAVATLVSPSGKIYYGGLVDGRGSITVSDPLLWWPEGVGVSNLYDLSVNLYHGDSAEDVYEVRIGLRDLSATFDGATVSVTVGGLPVFLKGMRVVPETFGAYFIEPARAARLVAAAASVGVNAFYVSSCGKLPDSEFLDLCDRHGILVVLGIGDRNPSDGALDDALKREIADGPRRLSYHASLAAFYIDSDTTPRASALSEMLSTYCFGIPALVASGEPLTLLPVSVPELRTLEGITDKDENNVLSRSAESRTDRPGAIADALVRMSSEYRFPIGTSELSYLSELSALDALSAALSSARSEGAHAIFIDRLNDPEPRISASTVDFFGRWTAAHYRLRRLYSPLSVLHRRDGYTVSFTVYNDRAKDYAGIVTYRVLDVDNRELHRGSFECSHLGEMSSIDLGSVDLGEYIRGYERERYLVYTYSDGIQTRDEIVLFAPRKHFKYKDPAIRTTVTGSGRKFDITLYPEYFAERVRLGFGTVDAIFDENYVDLTGGAPRRLLLETVDAISAERLASELTVTHLYTVGRSFD